VAELAPRPTVDRRPLSERLRPARLAGVIGNTGAVGQLRAWAETWARSTTPPARRAAVLRGPPGVGKTTAALAVAADFGWTVVEMNASEARNQTAIDLVAGRASLTHTLGDTGKFRTPAQGGRTLILLDEADCLTGRATEESAHRPSPLSFRDFLRGRYGSVDALNQGWKLGETGRPPTFPAWSDIPVSPGRGAFTKLPAAQADIGDWRGSSRPVDTSDRGGLGAIARLVRETRQPLVLTVNDERPLTRYSPVFRSGVLRLAFDRLDVRELTTFLRGVAETQSIALGPKALDAIVRRSRGDLRAAVNDLEAIAPLPVGPAQEGVLGMRDTEEEVAELVEEVFAEPRFYRSVEIRNRIDATPDDLFPWFEEASLRFPRTLAGTRAGIDAIARAERHLARSRRYRVYGLWSFATELMTSGPSTAIAAAGGSRPDARALFPSFLGEMGRSKATRAARQGILDKADRRLHLSRRKGAEATWPFLESVFSAPGVRQGPLFDLRRAIVTDFGLTPEEVGLLAGVEPDAPGIQALFPPPPTVAEPAPEPEPAEEPVTAPTPAAPRDAAKKKVQKSLGEF
jgi:DNA polymerase III delta prime subunit